MSSSSPQEAVDRIRSRRRHVRGPRTRRDLRGRPGRDRPGRPGRTLPLRPRAQGLPRHRSQHDVEGVVHGRKRRPQRRLLPHDRQHECRDAAIRRHRRNDLHGPPDERHELDRPGARPKRHDLQGHEHTCEREVPDRHRLRGRSRHRRDRDESRVQGGGQEERQPTPLSPLRSDGERKRRRRKR